MKFFKPTIRAYWWTERPNFGDALAPLLLKHFAGVDVVWDTVSHSSIASVGSILEHIPPLWDGYILGSGKLMESSRLHLHTNTAKVISVRGPLSARGVPGSFTLGDPGVLANELVGPQEKQYDLGIVPHWQDTALAERFIRLCDRPGQVVTVIDPSCDPLEVLAHIGKCRRIVTSSLHGMIVADAFGIPRRVEACSEMDKDGGDFKFRDYSASIQMPFKTGVMQEASRFRVEDVQFSVYDAYQYLGRMLR